MTPRPTGRGEGLNALAVEKMRSSLLYQALTRPATVGAIAPSSAALSRAMAREAAGADCCVELGAGTGPVTEALRTAHPKLPITAVEIQAPLAARLQHRFPDVTVLLTPAAQVLRELRGLPENTVVVSSLPFRSLPGPVREQTVAALLEFLGHSPLRRLVQFTYQPRAPFALPESTQLQWTRRSLVWRNVPPAGVWTLGR